VAATVYLCKQHCCRLGVGQVSLNDIDVNIELVGEIPCQCLHRLRSTSNEYQVFALARQLPCKLSSKSG
jgi:hypothetical protein